MKNAGERYADAIRVRTVDVRSGRDLTPMATLPGMLPRVGDKIDLKNGTVWTVKDVFWNGHPLVLEPTLHLESNR